MRSITLHTTYMRTFIGSTRYSALALVSVLAFAATASAQVSLKTDLNASVQGGRADAGASANASATVRNLDARVNGEAMSQLHATTTAKAHANENSALMATTTATTSANVDTGRPVKVTARFLGLFPAEITGKVTVDADGSAKIKYPWYRFLFALRAAADASASAQ